MLNSLNISDPYIAPGELFRNLETAGTDSVTDL